MEDSSQVVMVVNPDSNKFLDWFRAFVHQSNADKFGATYPLTVFKETGLQPFVCRNATGKIMKIGQFVLFAGKLNVKNIAI